jgi:hypothetical protein
MSHAKICAYKLDNLAKQRENVGCALSNSFTLLV